VFEHLLVEHYSDFATSDHNKNFEKLVTAKIERRKKSLEYIKNRKHMLRVSSHARTCT
jgi:hypothetical protein